MLRLDCTVIIDPNVRVRGNQTFSGFEDIKAHGRDDHYSAIWPEVGDIVMVLEEESGAETTGTVTDIDFAKELIFLKVDWPTLRIPDAEVRD